METGQYTLDELEKAFEFACKHIARSAYCPYYYLRECNKDCNTEGGWKCWKEGFIRKAKDWFKWKQSFRNEKGRQD